MYGTGMHAWALDLDSGELEVTASRDGKTVRISRADGAAGVFADDRPALDETIARAIAGDGRFEIDHRYIQPESGEVAWYRARGFVLRDADGVAIRIVGTSQDVTDYKLAELMQQLSAQLVVADDVAAAYERIVDVAIAMLGSDAASLQLYCPVRDELELIASRGLPDEMVESWHWIGTTSRTVTAEALAVRARVVVRDVGERYPTMAQAGIRATQATPLVSRAGQLIGMLATQWRRAHTPSPRELQLFDVLVRQAADLVERAQAEAALRESEARFRTLFEAIDDGFYLVEVVLDDAGNCTDLIYLEENPAAVELSGTRLVGRGLRSAVPHAHELWFQACGRVARTGTPERVELMQSNRWFEGRIFHPEAARPGSRRVALVWRDVTERKRTAMHNAFSLRLSEALRPLADTLDIQAAALRILGEQIAASRVVYAWIVGAGHACEVVVNFRGDGVMSLVGMHPVGEFMRETLLGGSTMVVHDTGAIDSNSPLERAAHRRAQIGAHITVPLVKGGRLISFMSAHAEQPRAWTLDEIALVERTAEHTWAAVERAMAEAEVRRARDQLELRVAKRTDELARANAELRAEMAERGRLQRQLATAQEAERRRVARDLHDQTGQLLAGLAIAVRGIATAPEKLSDLRSIADELAAQVHSLAVQLRPVALDDLGLVPALRQLIDGWAQRVGVPVDFETATLAERLPPEVETVLYRVVQEALTNTYKHAEATTVSVITSSIDGIASAIVEDNGRGFDPTATPKDRIGLLGMRERVALAGGELVVESAPHRGTTVIARIPLAPAPR